jgi:hypothetical protein
MAHSVETIIFVFAFWRKFVCENYEKMPRKFRKGDFSLSIFKQRQNLSATWKTKGPFL